MTEGNPNDLSHLLDGINFAPLERDETKWQVIQNVDHPDADHQNRVFELSKGETRLDLFVGSEFTTLFWAGEPPEEFMPGGGRTELETHLKLHETITHTLPEKLFPTTYTRSAENYKSAYRAYSKVELEFEDGELRKYRLQDESARIKLAWDFLDDLDNIASLTITGSEISGTDFNYALAMDYDRDENDPEETNMRLRILNKRKRAWNPEALEWVLDTAVKKDTIWNLHGSARELSKEIISRIQDSTQTT